MDRVFVLRCWREGMDNDVDTCNWRVQISEVNERRRYLTDGIENAFDFIRDRLQHRRSGASDLTG